MSRGQIIGKDVEILYIFLLDYGIILPIHHRSAFLLTPDLIRKKINPQATLCKMKGKRYLDTLYSILFEYAYFYEHTNNISQIVI